MAEYHVGCGLVGIYAGTLKKQGRLWMNKSNVTDEALSAVAQFLLLHNEAFEFDYSGKSYRLAVSEIESEVSSEKDSN